MSYIICPECKNKETIKNYKYIEDDMIRCPKCDDCFSVINPNVVSIENEFYSIDIKILIVDWKHPDFKYIDAHTIEIGDVKFEGTLEVLDAGQIDSDTPHPMVFAADDQCYWYSEADCFDHWSFISEGKEEKFIYKQTDLGLNQFGDRVPDGAGLLIEFTNIYDCKLDDEGDIDFNTAELITRITPKITQL